MKETFRQLQSQTDIYMLLDLFTAHLHSLSSGQVDRHALAKKFADHAVVLELDVSDKVAGFVAFYCNDRERKEAYLSMLAVLPEFRRHGFGRQLLSAAIAQARASGMEQFTLEVRKDNASAIRFYLDHHFCFREKETPYSRFMTLPL